MKRRLLYLILTFKILSCCQPIINKSNLDSKKDFYTIIDETFLKRGKFTKLFFLSDSGCSSCNNEFSKRLENEYVSDNLYVISANPLIVDISFFLKNRNNKNIVFDKDKIFKKKGSIYSSAIIYLGDNQIDSLVLVQY
jgi:hypothetical protein